MEDVHNYCLAFKTKKKNPMTIEISKVDPTFANENIHSIEVIDAFTSKYSNDELMNLIRKSNTLTEEYLMGELIIIDNTTGWRYSVLLDDGFTNINMIEYLASNKSNKDIMNKIYNKIKNHIVSDVYNDFCKQLFLEETNILVFFSKFKNLSYLMRRDIKILCDEFYKKEQLVKELKNNN